VLLCHLSEAVAAPLSRGDSPKHGDSERIREQAPRRGYNAIEYFNRLLARVAWGAFIRAARSIASTGTFDAFTDAVPFAAINEVFDKRRGR
jgi:hypothetical protein